MEQNVIKTTKNHQATNKIQNVTSSNLKPMTTNTSTIAKTGTDKIIHEAVPTLSSTAEDCFITQASDSNSINIKKYDENVRENNFADKTIKSQSVGNTTKVIVNADAVTVNINTSSVLSLLCDETEKTNDVLDTKLGVERPYNGGKKTAEFSEVGADKDDLWNIIQANYNYIMNTSLLDICQETQTEIENKPIVQSVNSCNSKRDQTNHNNSLFGNTTDLVNWLCEMKQKLSIALTSSRAANFSFAELQRQKKEYSLLYQELLSHAHGISRCLRAAHVREENQEYQEELNGQQLQAFQLFNSNSNSVGAQNNLYFSTTGEILKHTTSTATHTIKSSSVETKVTNSSSRYKNFNADSEPESASADLAAGLMKCEGNLERLENCYHLLCLKALEVQIYLDGLITNKSLTPSENSDIENDKDDYSLEAYVDSDNATKEKYFSTKNNNSLSLSGLICSNIDKKHLSIATKSPASAMQIHKCMGNKLDKSTDLLSNSSESDSYTTTPVDDDLDCLSSNSSSITLNSSIFDAEFQYCRVLTSTPIKITTTASVHNNSDKENEETSVHNSSLENKLCFGGRSNVRSISVNPSQMFSSKKFSHSRPQLNSDTFQSYKYAAMGEVSSRVQKSPDQPTTRSLMHNKEYIIGGINKPKDCSSYDCEAFDESSETDLPAQSVSDFSKNYTSSTATDVQTNKKSHGNFSKYTNNTSKNGFDKNKQSSNIVKTVERHRNHLDWKSNYPYSSLCLSQLTTATEIARNVNNSKGLYNDLMRISALNSLSSEDPNVRSTVEESSKSPIKSYYSERLFKHGNIHKNELSNLLTDSSILATKKLDALSPPRTDSFQQNKVNIIKRDGIANSFNQTRRRRKLRLERKRKLKSPKVRKLYEEFLGSQSSSSFTLLSSSLTAFRDEKFDYQKQRTVSKNYKLDLEVSNSTQAFRCTSASDFFNNSCKVNEHHRSPKRVNKSIVTSIHNNSNDDNEIHNIFQQNWNHSVSTHTYQLRSKLPNSLRDLSCAVLSTEYGRQTKDIYTFDTWKELSFWCESETMAYKMQNEMIKLKHEIYRLGNRSPFELFDIKQAIQIAIESLKNESMQLQNFFINMRRLNASVHSWLAKGESKLHASLNNQKLENASVKVAMKRKIVLEKKEPKEPISKDDSANNTTSLIAPESTTLKITVPNRNGNQLKTLSTTPNASQRTKVTSTVLLATANTNLGNQWDLYPLMKSESKLYSQLKDEVVGMYFAWNEARVRVNTTCNELEESMVNWRLLDTGLKEFHAFLNEDRCAVKGLIVALNNSQITPVQLIQSVKLVAHLLSQNMNVSPELITMLEQPDLNHMLHIAQFTTLISSLSNLDITDCGKIFDDRLLEHKQRLTALHHLAMKLESLFTRGSNAVKSIAASIKIAEADMKNLQNTYRDLIVSVAIAHQNMKQRPIATAQQKILTNGEQKVQQDSNPIYKNKRDQHAPTSKQNAANSLTHSHNKSTEQTSSSDNHPDSEPTVDRDVDAFDDENNKAPKCNWIYRIVRPAVLVLLVLIIIICIVYFVQPKCCDNLNNLSNSFRPHLQYVRGPPPV
ncbi:uncharacterized protein LOC119689476 [Teleopsis dalmanni]|uniref:uncharacterized protein LOC119689476 n=2 Tax=Teleopsis dalmanni TaxID=139649 RepID=UPI0018CC8AE0|nr:uncharacterized protein LOC119689476 [Teleopsis dalmanni]